MSSTYRLIVSLAAATLGVSSGVGITLSTEHIDRKAYQEDMLIRSLNNCPLCAAKEPCLHDCRESQQKSWSECLNRCLGDNPLLLETFTSIIRSEEGGLKGFGS